MKSLIYLLIDFENVQPSAADIARIRGQQYRLWVFHGPHQNKFDAEMVKAWQPLGDQVHFIQSSKTGKNALDFHIAFSLGQLHQVNLAAACPARYIVISGDGGFEALLEHMRKLGCCVGKAASISAALGMAKEQQRESSSSHAAEPSNAVSPAPVPVATSEKPSTPAKKEKPASPAKPKAAPRKTTAATSSKVLRKTLAADDVIKVIDYFRAHAKNRPAKRRTLEHHVVSVLGNGVTEEVGRAVVNELERMSVVRISGSKIEYKIPKAKKA